MMIYFTAKFILEVFMTGVAVGFLSAFGLMWYLSRRK
jgi:ABC-type antimicrobial peptide transport system permease subunit